MADIDMNRTEPFEGLDTRVCGSVVLCQNTLCAIPHV